MPQGIQVFNADGSLQFDTTNRLLRSLTSVMSGTANGSISVPGATQGAVAAVANTGGAGAAPVVSAAGTTVSWDFTGIPSDKRADARIDIMVF